jgi:hypothetical protein
MFPQICPQIKGVITRWWPKAARRAGTISDERVAAESGRNRQFCPADFAKKSAWH